MPTYGAIEEFSGVPEDWDSYSERLDQYFEANDLAEILLLANSSNQASYNSRQNRRRAILLSVLGSKTYTLLRNLCLPQKPAEKNYNELIQLLKTHYSPKPSETIQRYKFNTRQRKPEETIAIYMSELRKLAENCNFGNVLNDMLRDRLVCGVNDAKIQRLLLMEDRLTLDKAFKIACSQETADRDVNVLQGITNHTSQVQKITTKKPTSQYEDQRRKCFRCGDTRHFADKCKHIKSTCKYCQKVGHIEQACFKKERDRCKKNKVHEIYIDEEERTESDDSVLMVYSVNTVHPPIFLDVNVNNVPVTFELDTGSGVSLMNSTDFQEKFGNIPLKKSEIRLKCYNQNKITVVGETDVTVQYNDQTFTLPLLVVDGKGVPLFGRSWLKKIQLPWSTIFSISSSPPSTENSKHLQTILNDNKALFDGNPGLLQGFKAHLDIKEDAQPIFCKARPVPFSIKSKIEDELTRLEDEGIITKVTHSDWAAPVVPVIKPSGKLRLCGDFKVTVNKVALLDKYPLPRIDELFTNLSGGKHFSKLDLSQAYHQIELDEASSTLATVNTHCGLFRYNRLPYGVSSAVSLFQRVIDNLLKGIPGVCVYLDDILVTGRDDAEHLTNLHSVLKKLSDSGLKLAKDKCHFLLPSVKYLGFRVTQEGIQPTGEKVRAIKEAKAPRNVQELRSFIGLVNYYNLLTRI